MLAYWHALRDRSWNVDAHIGFDGCYHEDDCSVGWECKSVIINMVESACLV